MEQTGTELDSVGGAFMSLMAPSIFPLHCRESSNASLPSHAVMTLSPPCQQKRYYSADRLIVVSNEDH